MAQDKLQTLLVHYKLDGYYEKLKENGITTLETFAKLEDPDLNKIGLTPGSSDYNKLLQLALKISNLQAEKGQKDSKDKNLSNVASDNLPEVRNEKTEEIRTEKEEDDVVRCPKCGSTNIYFVTKETGSSIDKKDSCCGYLLCGPIGLLCGVKDKKETTTVRKCMRCNNEF